MDKHTLFWLGLDRISEFLKSHPEFSDLEVHHTTETYGSCAYYSHMPNRRSIGGGNNIYIDVAKCARLGYGGPAWSWPGYKIDRTPYGVLVHELGHHVDTMLGYPSRRPDWRSTKAEAVSGYEPNPAEMFAESFRLWWTNPDLFRMACPMRARFFAGLGLKPRTDEDFRTVLAEMSAPDRQIKAAAGWVTSRLRGQ